MQLTLRTYTDVKLFPGVLIRHSRVGVSVEEDQVVLFGHDHGVDLVRTHRNLYLQVLEGADFHEGFVLIFTKT